MRWRTGRRSKNIEDLRHTRPGRRGLGIPGMGGRGIRVGGKGGGILTIIIILVAMYFGVDPRLFFQGGSPSAVPTSQEARVPPKDDELAQFVSVVLADTEDTWHNLFKQQNQRYQEPKLVLFRDAVRSACGFANAAVGPFYCPADHKLYIDLSFYRDLKQRLNAPGDFAQAYVIAHEVGHHVQTLLGISQQVHAAKQRLSKVDANALSVRQELQADCFAGLWAHHAQRSRKVLEQGDLEEALNAASAIGDDRLQKQGRGYVTPESFTHGTSAQRMRWFRRGYEQGEIAACDTFNTSQL